MSIKLSKNALVFWPLFLILLTFAVFRPVGFDSDSIGYSNWILQDLRSMGESSFWLIVDFWNLFFDIEVVPRLVFATYAILNMLVIKMIINKASNYRVQSLVLYFLLVYSILTLTQIRVGLASAIFVYALLDLYDRKKIGFMVKMMLSISFHNMMAVFLPFFFLSSKDRSVSYFCILFIVVYFIVLIPERFFIDFAHIIVNNLFPESLMIRMGGYWNEDIDAVSVFNYHVAFVWFVYFLTILNFKFLTRMEIFLMKVVGWGMFLYFLTSFMTTMSARVLNVIVVVCIFLIPSFTRNEKYRSILFFSVFIFATLLFFNTHIRNNLVNFEVLFG